MQFSIHARQRALRQVGYARASRRREQRGGAARILMPDKFARRLAIRDQDGQVVLSEKLELPEARP